MRDFGDDVFSGTAYYYAKYRPAYPQKLFTDIIKFFNLNGHGRLLDLGCGTGEMTIPLVGCFENVLAIDPDAEMLSYGRQKAQAARIANIQWQKGSSKNLRGIDYSYKLITMGQSFHWMDQKPVLTKLYGLVEPGGGVVIVGSGGKGPRTAQNPTAARKEQVIKNLLAKYIGPKRRAGQGFYLPIQLSWEKDLFPNSKFGVLEKQVYNTQIVRNVSQELGYLYSLSWAKRVYFGNQISNFETEFRHQLSAISADGKFLNKLDFEAYFLRKN